MYLLLLNNSYIITVVYVYYAKQKHLGYKKCEANQKQHLTGMCNQKLRYQLRPRSYFTKTIFNSLNDIQ